MVLDYKSPVLSQHGLQFRNHPGAPGEGAADAFHMSNAVVIPANASRIIVGGKIGLRADDTAPNNLKEEIDQAFQNVQLALKQCGLGENAWEHVYKITTFQVPGNDEVGEVLMETAQKYFKSARPAFTAVVVHSLLHPDCHVELEVEAFLPPKAKL